MSESKHTPEPWEANTFAIYGGERRELIAHVGGTMHPVGQRVPEQLANARLIAAAPDLLASVKELRQTLLDGMAEDYDEMNAQLRRARIAIAKAEGQS